VRAGERRAVGFPPPHVGCSIIARAILANARSSLVAWPSGYLKVLPWNNWKTTYGLKFTPSFDFEYSEYTEQTGSCSL
jgi:hypothetical protein